MKWLTCINLLIFQFVNGYRHVPGHAGTDIQVPVIFGQQIDVVKYETLEVVQFTRLQEADVQQGSAVETRIWSLKTEVSFVQ